MMWRFLRQLIGGCRREKQADEMLRRHERFVEVKEREVKANVAAAQRLVERLREDVASWNS